MGKTYHRNKSDYDDGYDYKKSPTKKVKDDIRDKRREKQQKHDNLGEDDAGDDNWKWRN